MLLFLSESNVKQCLSMKDCIEVNRRALSSLVKIKSPHDDDTSTRTMRATANAATATGVGVVPTRLGLPYHDDDNLDWSLFKPAAYYSTTRRDWENHSTGTDSNLLPNDQKTMATTMTTTETMGMKIVSIRADNPTKRHLPLVPATVVLVDPPSGIVNAVVSATYMTAARTAAGSALATQLCCSTTNSPLHHLVIFGAGLQAYCHIHAISCIAPQLQHITIINRSLSRAEGLIDQIQQEQKEEASSLSSTSFTMSCYSSLDDKNTTRIQNDILPTADVIVTCTNTLTPLFDGSCLKPNCHINGIGSYTLDMQEVDSNTVQRSIVLVDTWDAITTVGDLIPLQEQKKKKNETHNNGTNANNDDVVLLGDLLVHNKSLSDIKQNVAKNIDHSVITRTTQKDCTFYKAVGTAIQDVMTGDMVVSRAKEMGIGQSIDMS